MRPLVRSTRYAPSGRVIVAFQFKTHFFERVSLMSQLNISAMSPAVRRPRRLSQVVVSKLFGLLLAVFLVPSWTSAEDDATAAAVKRISNSVQYLSSDELEGRGIGTAGLDKAANFIADEFTKYGLKTDLFDGSPFQKFQLATSPEQGPPEHNVLVLVGPPAAGSNDPRRVELKLGKDFQTDRKSTRLNSSHERLSRMPSSA